MDEVDLSLILAHLEDLRHRCFELAEKIQLFEERVRGVVQEKEEAAD